MSTLRPSEVHVLTRAVGIGFYLFFIILFVGFAWAIPDFKHHERREPLSLERLFCVAFTASLLASWAVVGVYYWRQKKRGSGRA